MSFATLLQESKDERESWRYTSLTPYEKEGFVAASDKRQVSLPAPLALARLVFVGGQYRADLSQEAGLPEGFIAREKDGVCCLRVQAQTCLVLRPLELLFIGCGESDTNIKLTLGANSRLTLIERHIGQDASASLPRMDIVLEEQAKLVHAKTVTGGARALHVSKTKTRLAAGAFYDFFVLVRDGGLTRCEKDVVLAGELAGAHLTGAALLRGAAHADMVVRVSHDAPHGTSRQIFKNVLDDKARGVFQGKIYVAKGAQKTDGHQLSRALLLSDKAEMDAKPELEIYADDVKCSHGSAIGDLDEQEMFYLRSRGLSEKEARGMLVEAFVGELIDAVSSEDIAALLRQEVSLWLK